MGNDKGNDNVNAEGLETEHNSGEASKPECGTSGRKTLTQEKLAMVSRTHNAFLL
jgi:hypothetical protein